MAIEGLEETALRRLAERPDADGAVAGGGKELRGVVTQLQRGDAGGMAAGEAEEGRSGVPAPGVDRSVDGSKGAHACAVEILVDDETGDLRSGGADGPGEAASDSVLEDRAGSARRRVGLAEHALAGEGEDDQTAVDGGDNDLGPTDARSKAADSPRMEECWV